MEAINVLWSFVSATLGVSVIILWNAHRANRGKFNFETWLVENSNTIAFTFAAIILMATISAIIPEVAITVKTITGLDLPMSGNKQAWFTFGAIIYEGVRKTKKKQ